MESSTCASVSDTQPMEKEANDIYHPAGVEINDDVWYQILLRCNPFDLLALERTDAALASLLNHRIFRNRYPLAVMEEYRKKKANGEGCVPDSLTFNPKCTPANDALRAQDSRTWLPVNVGSPVVEWQQFRVQDSAKLWDAMVVRASSNEVDVSLDIFKHFPRWTSTALPGAVLVIRLCGFVNDSFLDEPMTTLVHQMSLRMHFLCLFTNPQIDRYNLVIANKYDASKKYMPIVSTESVFISGSGDQPKRVRHFEYTFEAELKENTEFAIRCLNWVAITELSASIVGS